MKRTLILMRCLETQIKKIFFKGEKHDENQPCRELKKRSTDLITKDDKARVEEYLDTYRLTTRWQTL